MSIVIYNSPSFSHFTGKQRSIKVNGDTVGECLKDLVKQFPEMKKVLLDKTGNVRPYLRIYINNDGTRPAELATPVKDGDELHLLTMYGGG
jgi:molybdopterin converting factor small subunit